MDKNIEFRKQMRGYNTEDVNRFISEENVRFNKIEERYKKDADEMSVRIKELEYKLEESKKSDAEIRDLMIKNELLTSELESLKTSLSEKDVLIESMKEELEKADEKMSELKRIPDSRIISTVTPDMELCREKAEKYDAICDRVDEILNFAKEEAEKIIKEASDYKIAAQRNAKKESDAFKSSINNRSDSIIEDLKKTIRKQILGK